MMLFGPNRFPRMRIFEVYFTNTKPPDSTRVQDDLTSTFRAATNSSFPYHTGSLLSCGVTLKHEVMHNHQGRSSSEPKRQAVQRGKKETPCAKLKTPRWFEKTYLKKCHVYRRGPHQATRFIERSRAQTTRGPFDRIWTGNQTNI